MESVTRQWWILVALACAVPSAVHANVLPPDSATLTVDCNGFTIDVIGCDIVQPADDPLDAIGWTVTLTNPGITFSGSVTATVTPQRLDACDHTIISDTWAHLGVVISGATTVSATAQLFARDSFPPDHNLYPRDTLQSLGPTGINCVQCTGTIGDFVWMDVNKNGIQDDGNGSGIAGVTVTLSGADSATTTTDNTGHYLFSGLCAGNYTVTVGGGLPPGVTPTTPNAPGSNSATDSNGSPAAVTLPNDSSTNLTIDFGYVTPEQGKTFSIGPSSMEGDITITTGDWVSGGYSFKWVNGVHPATQFIVGATVTVPVTCRDGSQPTGSIVIPLTLGTPYSVPANNTNWLPTGDANSILSWQGAVQAPDLCHGAQMRNQKGATFTATVLQNPPTGSFVDFRFKYRDPNAKGKGNVNCTDADDPRRNRADVCGASWSATFRDP